MPRSGARARAAMAGDPSLVGRWAAPFHLPVVAIHAAVLPTGKVMLFSDRERVDNTTQAWLWEPTTGALNRVDPPLWRDPADGRLKPANIWCGGQSFLADGRLLVTGGTLAYGTEHKGLNKVYTFNPWNETWTEQPDMRGGRWYPSQVLRPDGQTVIMGGLNESGTGGNSDIELFTPSPDPNGRGTVTLLGSRGDAPPLPGNYPHLFTMPSGRTLAAGPVAAKVWFMSDIGPDSIFSWSKAANASRSRGFGTAVLLPGGPAGSREVMQLGGSAAMATDEAVNTTEVYNETTNSWRPGSPMNVGRGHHNTVLLPDEGMVTVGGGVGIRDGDQWAADPEQRQIELYEPATRTWRLGPEQAERRSYHSTAMLLPDGRVLSAGDDYAGGKLKDTGEVYEPPYLFRGPRPTIDFAPAGVRWGASFGVATPDADVTRAVLIAPAAVTHSTDMNQRLVPLTLARRPDGRGVDLTAPPSPNVAPPGYYMLFLLNERGIPSVARWVRLDADAADEPLPEGSPATGADAGLAGGAAAAQRSPTGSSTRTATGSSTRTALLRGGLRVPVRCSRACTVALEARLGAGPARKLRFRAFARSARSPANDFLVGRGSTTVKVKGTADVLVRLTPEAKLKLRRVRRVTLTVRGKMTLVRGKPRRINRRITPTAQALRAATGAARNG